MNVFPDFGTYRTITKLGEGGTGVVYLAVSELPGENQALVVLKALKPESEQRRAGEQLLIEARVAVPLNHPNIVRTLGVTVWQGQPLILMEFLDGQPFHKLLTKAWKTQGQVPLGVSLKIIVDLLAGIHHAHEATSFAGTPLGLVHRDVSPDNVLVTFDGDVKVLDFGIAKTATSVSKTTAGIVKGKLRYMAPEQLAGRRLDRRADVFGVGVMLWEALADERMWRNLPDKVVMDSLQQGQLRSPRELNPDVPVELERICMKALAVEPGERYSSAAELRAALVAVGGLATRQTVARFVSDLFSDVRLNFQAMLARELRAPRAPADPKLTPALARQAPISSRPPALPRTELGEWALASPREMAARLAKSQTVRGGGRGNSSAPRLPRSVGNSEAPASDSVAAEAIAASRPPARRKRWKVVLLCVLLIGGLGALARYLSLRFSGLTARVSRSADEWPAARLRRAPPPA